MWNANKQSLRTNAYIIRKALRGMKNSSHASRETANMLQDAYTCGKQEIHDVRCQHASRPIRNSYPNFMNGISNLGPCCLKNKYFTPKLVPCEIPKNTPSRCSQSKKILTTDVCYKCELACSTPLLLFCSTRLRTN
jgi:hypothetical protein